MEQTIREILRDAGAVAVGFALAEPVGDRDWSRFLHWLDDGHNADMAYMHNYPEIRRDPRLLLEGAQSIISLAFPYEYSHSEGMIAAYALGDDYHIRLRSILNAAVETIKSRFGGDYRICIDSAPILERYWAERAEIGLRAFNGLIEIPPYGTQVFLSEIITTLPLHQSQDADKQKVSDILPQTDPYSAPYEMRGCEPYPCPTGALRPDGTVDARRCLSYLTIEHRGPWNPDQLKIMHSKAGRHTLFGCDRCQVKSRMDDAKKIPASEIPTPEDILKMSKEDFSKRFRNSPIKRSKLEGLQRNADNIIISE